MRRGRTARETCDLNGWGVGTVVRGHEGWSNGEGCWTTWRITGMGEAVVLARTVLSERTKQGEVVSVDDQVSCEHTVTFTEREWREVPA